MREDIRQGRERSERRRRTEGRQGRGEVEDMLNTPRSTSMLVGPMNLLPIARISSNHTESVLLFRESLMPFSVLRCAKLCIANALPLIQLLNLYE